MALPQLHPLPLQRQQPSAPLRLTTAASGLGYVCVAVAPKEVTGLILDLCSELLLDQYSFYKGSDLSFITISTNWPSPGVGGAHLSAAHFLLVMFINDFLSATGPIISQMSLVWARVSAETLTARLQHDGSVVVFSLLCSIPRLSAALLIFLSMWIMSTAAEGVVLRE